MSVGVGALMKVLLSSLDTPGILMFQFLSKMKNESIPHQRTNQDEVEYLYIPTWWIFCALQVSKQNW
jgi:hypothetical protein